MIVSDLADAHGRSTVIRTYRFRLYPNAGQVRALNAQLAFACDLYNAALEQRRDAWRRQRKSISLYDQMRDLTEVRAAGLGPTDMGCEVQRDPLRRLARAFDAFFQRVKAGETPGFPRFRSKARYDSLTWPSGDGAHVTGRGTQLRGVGSVRAKWHRALPEGSVVKAVTVTRSARHWYVCLGLEMPTTASVSRKHDPDVGIDLGVATFSALSTGELILGPRAGDGARKRTRRLARKLARCKRGSLRRRKAVKTLRRSKERESAVRQDHRHKLSTDLVRRFGTIYVEDLRIRNMVRSAKGTSEEPGRKVRQKAGLNRSISDQGWGELLDTIEYKAEYAGTRMVRVPAVFTSQTCAKCRTVDAKSRISQAVFACVECGHRDHADINAAKVIKMAGQAIQTRTVGPEPTPLSEKSHRAACHAFGDIGTEWDAPVLARVVIAACSFVVMRDSHKEGDAS